MATPCVWKMATCRIWNRANSGLRTSCIVLPEKDRSTLWSPSQTSHRRLYGTTPNASRRGKSVYWKVSNIDETVADILDREEGLAKANLVRCAKLLDKKGKNQQALEVFEWMQRNQMTFSPSENVTFVDLLSKTKGLLAAQDFVNHLPDKDKNQAAFSKALEYYIQHVKDMDNSPLLPWQMILNELAEK